MQASAGSSVRAFTLVELSIVLVILGLLIGGVLTGQSLIHAAELRAVSTESQRYITAMSTFRDKYFAIPGDMSNASSYWPSIGNGDANSQVNNTGSNATNEPSLFWMHLANAGLIEGNYTGFSSADSTLTPGSNIPQSKLNSAGWRIIGLGSVNTAGAATYTNNLVPSATAFYAGDYGNVLTLGKSGNAVNPGLSAASGIMKSEDAFNIDTKMDDGKPDSGKFRTYENEGSATAGAGCVNQAASNSALAPAVYDLTTATNACDAVISTGY